MSNEWSLEHDLCRSNLPVLPRGALILVLVLFRKGREREEEKKDRWLQPDLLAGLTYASRLTTDARLGRHSAPPLYLTRVQLSVHFTQMYALVAPSLNHATNAPLSVQVNSAQRTRKRQVQLALSLRLDSQLPLPLAGVSFILLISRQGKVRLAKWYTTMSTRNKSTSPSRGVDPSRGPS